MSSNKTLLSPAVKRAGRSRARIKKKKKGRRHSRGEAKANTRAAAVRVFCRVRSRSRRCGRELQRLYGHLQLHRSFLFSLAVKLERDAQKVKSELAHTKPTHTSQSPHQRRAQDVHGQRQPGSVSKHPHHVAESLLCSCDTSRQTTTPQSHRLHRPSVHHAQSLLGQNASLNEQLIQDTFNRLSVNQRGGSTLAFFVSRCQQQCCFFPPSP